LENSLQYLQLENFSTENGFFYPRFELSYQVFGLEPGTAPTVLVNHALTGNSCVAGPGGWWQGVIGPGKAIDTARYSVVAFNVPGNGFDGKSENLIANHEDFTARDVARLFALGIRQLGIERLFAVIGGSLGGGIAWEMAFEYPHLMERLIPVAADWKASDWIIAHNKAQQQILAHSSQPVHDARMMAMLFYRTAESFKRKFNRARLGPADCHAQSRFKTESWLTHHGLALQERFPLTAYQLMNHLLSTIDVTRGRAPFKELVGQLQASVVQVAIDSDFFFVPQEIKETRDLLTHAGVENQYHEIHSVHGHDAFLIEQSQLDAILRPVFARRQRSSRPPDVRKPVVIKFGGRSLANGTGFEQVLEIIQQKHRRGQQMLVVASARGSTTDDLLSLLHKAERGEEYKADLKALIAQQRVPGIELDLDQEAGLLAKWLEGVSMLRESSPRVRDQVLAQGELMAVKVLAAALQHRGVNARAVDARKLLVSNNHFGKAQPFLDSSRLATRDYLARFWAQHGPGCVPVVTGFIAATEQNETTTLGRNGSNYSAALLASFLSATELQNYTHVDGIYTANPELVPSARPIAEMTYREASELAHSGARILHAKTILPLVENNIPLRVLNTFKPDSPGTLVKACVDRPGIRAVTTQDNVALITLFGRGLLDKPGIDGRIFSCLGQAGINVSVISQGSSQRGVGFVVSAADAEQAKRLLENEFSNEMRAGDVDYVKVTTGLGVLSVIGQQLGQFHSPYSALAKNGIVPLLINSTVTGDNIFLVLRQKDLRKAANVIHSKIFGVSTSINLVLFGKGQVGSELIEQIISHRDDIEARRGVHLSIVAIADSQRVVFSAAGLGSNWRDELANHGLVEYNVNDIIRFAREHHLENLVAVDNTASEAVVNHYLPLVENGFDLVSSNKIANTRDFAFYRQLRQSLNQHQKKYLYETNVGAGLPLVDTIRLLHHSGENITAIKGIFSGSLSYLFNHFSGSDRPFSTILREAMRKGLTEPDPREDLSGMDVARKLLILARELDLRNELSDVRVENLIPEPLRSVDRNSFLGCLDSLDDHFERLKKELPAGHALRYVGVLEGDLQQDKGELSVRLQAVPVHSALGQVGEADSIFEIHTESYGSRPIVIQGAGAGARVTARGVLGDILRLSEKAT